MHDSVASFASSIPATAPIERPTYSICTMVSRPDEYAEMCESFAAGGFSPEDTQYLFIDNSTSNVADGFTALNRFLVEASEPYIILCHQDVLLLSDGRAKLDALLAELDAVAPKWAVCGNAGARSDGILVTRITDPHGIDRAAGGPFPARVMTLDENFILVRRDRNLAVSGDLSGYHLYGTDLCQVAAYLGYEAYVVDFHLKHKSPGNVDRAFQELRQQIARKHHAFAQPRWLPTSTRYPIYLSSSRITRFIARAMRKIGLSRFNQ